MLVGRSRFDHAGEAFLALVQGELRTFGRPAAPADVAKLLGLTEEELWTTLDREDRAALDALVARWNALAEGHAVARLLLIDHGDECELLLGHPLRPEHA
jgi:hypothetical protein